jgi:hypothetical protein
MVRPSNAILAARNYLDADPAYARVGFEGGRWRTPDGLGLSALADPLLVRVARSYDVALDSTRFWVDLGRLRDLRLVAIPRILASRGARLRARVFEAMNESGAALGDSGWSDLYPAVYPWGSLPVWHPSFVDGRLDAEQAGLFPMPWFHLFEAAVFGRWLLIEIDDTESEIGYVDIPRLFVSPGWQPSLNIVYGAGMALEPRTEVVESYGGAEFFEVLDGRRVFTIGFDYLPEDEAVSVVGDMQRLLGIHGQLFFIYNPLDAIHRHRRSMLCRMRRLSPIEAASYGRSRTTVELAEVIA